MFSTGLFGCSEPDHGPTNKQPPESSTETSVQYVGAQKCISCHEQQHALWQDSHHDLAMQPANEQTVLGDFNNTTFDYYGTVSTFYKKNKQFFVQTDGPDGKLTDYPIAYTFGVYPLQQYLIKFPNGHYQALNVVWDTHSKDEGGQRWFHLYPDEHIKHDDELHWTGVNQNWNFMCADCHSTNLQKNYDLASKTYNTTWSEIDVGCEACHGPASRHMAWAEDNSRHSSDKGLSVAFNERKNMAWVMDAVTGNAKRTPPKQSHTEIEVCAQCHSRRSTNYPGARPDHALLDNFRPALLTEPLYHADGQIDGEVYVYASFIQSKMYHAGVSCSDCHDPHSLKLHAEGNNLCAQCHLPSKFDTVEHHLHKPGTEGAQCIDCHMPAKKYMVVDPRNDHSFRIPRPDLSVKLGVPDVCTRCHSDKTSQWAAEKLEHKYGKPEKHYGEALHAGRQGSTGAEQLLSELITDDTQPAIARATAVTLLPPYLSPQSAAILQMAANDEQPLLGLGLAIALDAIPQQHRLPFAYPLLYDDHRITRALAGRSLLGISLENLPTEGSVKFDQAMDDYKTAQMFNADRPESLSNLASLYAQQGQTQQAEQFYKAAIELAPYFTPAYVNLADFYRSIGDDTSGEAVLQKALMRVTDNTPVHFALGLFQVRQQKLTAAIGHLRKAAESPTTTDRYVYTYAIALHSSGNAKQALQVLDKAQQQYPTNADIIYALISINKELGNQEKVKFYESKLATPMR
ncbi:MAG: tetratricopeptide repeat protein [Gammaproteobacteria bacterium]